MLSNALKSKFMEYLKELPSSPSLSSREAYIRAVELLGGKGKIHNNFQFLKNTGLVLGYLEDRAVATRSQYLSAVIHAVRFEKKLGAKLLDFYQKQLSETGKELDKKPKGKMSETQEENWIDWRDVLKRFESSKEDANRVYEELDNGKTMNNMRMDDIQKMLILSFFCCLEPRRAMDYQLLRITPGDLTGKLDRDCNWCSLSEKKILFNQFKTARKIGSQTISIPEDLYEIVKRYYDVMPNKDGFVFQRPDGMMPRGNNTITRLLNRVFHPLKVAVNILRHSYLTHKYTPDEEEMKKRKEREETALRMGHSRSQQEDYILDDSNVDSKAHLMEEDEQDEQEEKMKSVRVRKPRGKPKGGSRVLPVMGELESLGLADDEPVNIRVRESLDDPGENLRDLFIEI